uniref:TGF_BETA_2 domain-containing protein n=1 Tax=Heterorhabditis bacteriophora TaxID=37862 RepID=A0A1I7WH94_HETBA
MKPCPLLLLTLVVCISTSLFLRVSAAAAGSTSFSTEEVDMIKKDHKSMFKVNANYNTILVVNKFHGLSISLNIIRYRSRFFLTRRKRYDKQISRSDYKRQRATAELRSMTLIKKTHNFCSSTREFRRGAHLFCLIMKFECFKDILFIKIPPPCCVPTETTHLSILYMDEDNKIIIKNYPDIGILLKHYPRGLTFHDAFDSFAKKDIGLQVNIPLIDRPTSLSGKWSFLFHCMEQLNQLTTVLLAVTVSPSWRSSERAHPSHHTRCTEGLFDVGVNDWPVIVVQNPFFLTSNNFPPKVLLALPGKQRDACVEPTANAVFGEFMRHSLSGFPNSSHLINSQQPRKFLVSATQQLDLDASAAVFPCWNSFLLNINDFHECLF